MNVNKTLKNIAGIVVFVAAMVGAAPAQLGPHVAARGAVAGHRVCNGADSINSTDRNMTEGSALGLGTGQLPEKCYAQ